MKISKIKISKFHQFEDFELDLTYPKGHEKAGKPLDKVCFIGQSGTGKTTLLEMIKKSCFFRYSSNEVTPLFPEIVSKNPNALKAYFELQSDSYYVSFEMNIEKGLGHKSSGSSLVKAVLYFTTGITQVEFNSNGNTNGSHNEDESTFKDENRIDTLNYYPIAPDTIKAIWNGFYKFIKEYQQDEANFRINLTRRFEKEKIDISKEIEEWKLNNPNPLESVANECLDIILNKFNLAVQTEVEDVNKLNALQIRSLSEGITIPYESLSTGTKQIIFTAFPIYQLLEDDSIVLMDEPETSLYPDIQREIIPYYTSFDKNKTSQFFFATHSPIIASAFEPWEIVELKFDEKGKVYRDKYYEGENHVDNYKIDPRYLRWDDILTKVFDLEDDSNAEFRTKKLTEYAALKDKIKAWREEGKLENPTKDIKDKVAEFERMYDLLTGNWAVTNHAKN